jgi:hypothetical protein
MGKVAIRCEHIVDEAACDGAVLIEEDNEGITLGLRPSHANVQRRCYTQVLSIFDKSKMKITACFSKPIKRFCGRSIIDHNQVLHLRPYLRQVRKSFSIWAKRDNYRAYAVHSCRLRHSIHAAASIEEICIDSHQRSSALSKASNPSDATLDHAAPIHP